MNMSYNPMRKYVAQENHQLLENITIQKVKCDLIAVIYRLKNKLVGFNYPFRDGYHTNV